MVRLRAGGGELLVEHFGRERRKQYPKSSLTLSLGVTCLDPAKDDLEKFQKKVDERVKFIKLAGQVAEALGKALALLA